MIETNIKNLSVEEIMQKIKQEVQKRKQKIISTDIPMDSTHYSDNINSYEVEFTKLNVVDSSTESFEQKEVYEYADFSKYHDVEFIKNCYRGLLKREAESVGLEHYLHLLRSGEKNKSEIISILRYSKEGRAKNVKLLGSKKRYIVAVLNSVPFFGAIFKWFTAFFTLPRLIKRLNQYENFTYQLYMKNIDNEQKLQNTLNENIQDSLTSLNAFVNTKADKTDLEPLHAELESKADKTDLEPLHAELESKADKTELNIKNIETFKCENFLAKAISLTKHSLENKNFTDEKMYYSLFEDAFYESEIVKEKQRYYLKYIKKTSQEYHLDLGCGRGEFLEILKENRIPSLGIDINKIEVERLKANNFDVQLIDIDSFFAKNTKLFSSISSLQVFEHLNIEQIKKTIKNMYLSLKQNGIAIIETVNPHSYFAFGGFYMDETHMRPIPPEQLIFIMQWYGFKDVEIVYSSKLPEEFMVKDLKRNYYDYALIGYKR
jgi:2-polyprenyl-3-methyl-5-hydroxy-6-metoxy-1,4-benzoquinol methylase